MNMVQDNALGQDIKTIMADQLYEMRMLREEMKAASDKRDGSAIAMNPYASNAYYTEHHEKVINEAYGLADSKKGLVNTLADYANQTGYADVMLSKEGFIGGKGISARDEILAKDAMMTSIQRGVLDKAEGTVGFGADMAGGSAGTALATALGLGALPAIGLGIVGGTVAAHYTGKFIQEQKDYLDYRDVLMSSSDRFITIDETNDPTGGFTKREARKAARSMVRIADDMDLSKEEMSELFSGALQNNLLTGASDVETFEKNMSSLVENVKRTAKSLGKTYEEAVNMIGELGRSGVGVEASSLILGMSDGISAGLGMTSEQYTAFISGRTDSMVSGTGFDSDTIALSGAALDHRLASEIESAMSSKSRGHYENYLINNKEGISSLIESTSRQGTVANFNRQIAMAAASEGPNGDISIDSDKYQELSMKLARGEISIHEISNMAISNESEWSPLGLSVFEMSYDEFGRSHSLEHGKQATTASISAIMRETLGKEGFARFMEMDESARIAQMSDILEASGISGEAAYYFNEQLDESMSNAFWNERNVAAADAIRSTVADEYASTKNKLKLKSLPRFMKDWDASGIEFRFSDYNQGDMDASGHGTDIYQTLSTMGVAILGGDRGNDIQNALLFTAGDPLSLDFEESTGKERINRFVSEMIKDDNRADLIAHAKIYGDSSWIEDAMDSEDEDIKREAILKLVDMGLDGASAQKTYSESRNSGLGTYEQEVKTLEDSLKENNELLAQLLQSFTDGTVENTKILREMTGRAL